MHSRVKMCTLQYFDDISGLFIIYLIKMQRAIRPLTLVPKGLQHHKYAMNLVLNTWL